LLLGERDPVSKTPSPHSSPPQLYIGKLLKEGKVKFME